MTKSERNKWQQQAEPRNVCAGAAHEAALTLLPGLNENDLKSGFTGLRPEEISYEQYGLPAKTL